MTFLTYREISDKIDNLNVPLKKKIPAFIISFIISLIIVILPLFTLINLFIFRDYRKMIVLGFGLIIDLVFFITMALYYQVITKNMVKKTWVVALCDTLVMSILVLIAVLIIYMTGVLN